MTANLLLWTLDNLSDSTAFERLCVDLLTLNGYHDLVPIGGAADRGRDAEVRRGATRGGERTFFQFSYEKRWEAKLRRELRKVQSYRHEIDRYAFITTQRVSGAKRDELGQLVAKQFGWQLTIYDREWLRVQLEEVHPHLAKKYFALDVATATMVELDVAQPTFVGHAAARELYEREEYDAAAVVLRRWIREHPTDGDAWTVLAWCEYQQHHYADALASIAEAVALQPNDVQTQRIYAGILVEHGIREGERASIVTARDILARIVSVHNDALDLYNYGNALSALGDDASARDAYVRSLERDPLRAEAWKNLGSVYARLGNEEEEARSYNRALALKPGLPEALLANGIKLARSTPLEGAALIQRALDTTPAARAHWPSAWHSLADAYYRGGESTKALEALERGLAHHPNHQGLRHLKAHVLSKLWRADLRHVGPAEAYFRFCADAAPADFRPIEELASIYVQTNRTTEAWRLLVAFAEEAPPPVIRDVFTNDPAGVISSFRYLQAYRRFREFSPITPQLDELAAHGVESSPQLRRELTWRLALAYTTAYGALLDAPRTDEAFLATFATQKETIGRVFVWFVAELARERVASTREAKATLLTIVLMEIPEVALRETSRQLGFIAGVLSFPINSDDPPTPADLGVWQRSLFDELLRIAYEAMKLGPKAAEG
jgi:tetratricopeptide (TPR) repeat protein